MVNATIPTSKPTVNPEIDLDQARTFLEMLDPAGKFTFQVFDDTEDKNPSRAAKFHGTFDQHAAILTKLNLDRRGVHVTINETDLQGRKTENIKRARALFVDLDGAPILPVMDADVEPHIIVESSPGRFHAYWLVDDVALDEFGAIQRALAAKFNGDAKIHDLPRVMRLPGFLHHKREPVLCTLQLDNERPPYQKQEIIDGLKLNLNADEPPETAGVVTKSDFAAVLSGVPQGDRDESIFKFACSRLARGLSFDEVKMLVLAAACNCTPPFPENQAIMKLQQALKYHSQRQQSRHDSATTAPQTQSEPDQAKTPKQERPSKFRVLVNLLSQQDIAFFHDQFQHPWACLRINDHFENIRIRSGVFRNYLTRLHYLATGGGVGRETLQQIQDLCCAQALHDGEQRSLSYRTAWQDGRILIDLGRSDWAAVEISRDGWRIIIPQKPPFKRFSHMQALPEPASGGDIAAICQVLPVRDDSSRILLQCWLPTAFVPDIPCAALLLQGLQGSGKTFVSEILRMLVDPSATRSLSLARDATELVQALDHHHLPVFDNISSLPGWASDVLCRATTGLGHTKRELYTNDDDYTYFVQRSFILNGISLSTRPDLADRVLSIELDRIPDTDRKSKRELMQVFDAVQPGVFGALLDALVRAMQIRETLEIRNLPRLADWAEWAIAVAEALGIDTDRFIAALADNASRQHCEICQTDPTAVALSQFMSDRPLWTGTASALFAELAKIAGDEKLDRETTWPKSPSALSRRLRALTHNLMATGIDVQHQRIGSGRTRTWIISRAENGPEMPSAASVPSKCNDTSTLCADDTRTAIAGDTNAVRNTGRDKSAPGAIMDDTDSVDDISGLSGGPRDPRLIALGCYDCADLHNDGNHPVCIFGDGVVDLRNSGSVTCPKQL